MDTLNQPPTKSQYNSSRASKGVGRTSRREPALRSDVLPTGYASQPTPEPVHPGPLFIDHQGGEADREDAQRPTPYLVKRESESSDSEKRSYYMPILTKVSCTSVWCPQCFKRRAGKRASENMRLMNWRNVRHIILTLDRDNFLDGEAAYMSITRGKRVPGLTRDLRRYLGKKIKRWISFLEWHEDGFPHWHVIVEVDDTGKKGQIGHANIADYWGLGGVFETYPKNKQQWDNLTGYFKSSGYFDEKEKGQGKLPEWAIAHEGKIRRVNRSRFGWPDSGQYAKEKLSAADPQPYDDWDEGLQEEKPKKRDRPYSLILSACGATTRLRIMKEQRTVDTIIINLPLVDVVGSCAGFKHRLGSDGFEFLDGVGFVGFFNQEVYNQVMRHLMKFPHQKGFTYGQESMKKWGRQCINR